MNRTYRLVWSDAVGAFVAVAEFVRARGRRSAAGVVLCLAGTAFAAAPAPTQLPTGGVPTSGQASVSVQGARIDVVQTSGRAVIEWNTFDIGRDARVNFVQPGAGSVVLNRVLDTQPSRIFGSLTANGQVFLSNPNGVYFSPTARVDVGGLVATSARIGDADFAGGRMRFDGTGTTGSVINEGRLSAAPGGYVALLAPQVRNDGVVLAELGTVAMAAGAAYELRFDRERALGGVRVTPGRLAALVENGGAIRADAGLVVLSAHAANALQGGVVRTSGRIEATGLAAGPGGRILLDASQDIDVAGQVSAAATDAAGGAIHADAGGRLSVDSALLDASGKQGGDVVLSARHVVLEGSAEVNASGTAGGGRILVGGGFQGREASVRNAETTRVGAATILQGNAGETGAGGEVVVWSDRATLFEGRIGARGGERAGDGGRVEVSGRDWLGFRGQVDAGASSGAAGTLLLDPKNITVSNAAQTHGLDLSDTIAFGTNSTGSSVINPATITAVTNTGTAVTLQASNDLSVEANIVSTNPTGSGGDINLVAGRSVTINALINTDGGDLNVTANAPVAAGVDPAQRDAGAAHLSNNGIVVAIGGDVSFAIGAGAGHAGQSGSIATGAVIAGSLTVVHQGPTAGGTIDVGSTDVKQLSVTSAGARDITNSFGDITVQGGPAGSTASFNTAGGNITLNGASNDFEFLRLVGNNVSVNDLNSVRLEASTIGGDFNLTAHGPIASVGNIAVAGSTVIDARAAAFGVSEPDITLGGANSFQGPIRIAGGNNVLIRNQGAVTLGGGATSVNGTLDVESLSGGLQVTAPVTAGKSVTLNAAGAANLGATITSKTESVEVTASGDITASALTAASIILESGGHVSAGAIAAESVLITAGAAGDVTLTNASNDFASVAVTRGRNASIVNSTATEVGSSELSGNLSVVSAGSVTAGELQIGANSHFTVTAAGADLLLAAPGNSFDGTVTMTTAGAGSYRNVSFSDSGAVATVPVGFPVTGLNDVSFAYANALGFVVPAMTITGDLSVALPQGVAGGGITQQAGGIRISPPAPCAPLPCVPAWKGATFSTSPDASVTLTDPGNQIPGLKALSGFGLTLVSTGILNLGNVHLEGNLNLTTTGAIFQSGPASVAGSAAFTVGFNNLTLDDPGNAWNIIRIPSAQNVRVSTTTNTTLGASTVSGSFEADVPAALVTAVPPALVTISSNGETIRLQGTTTFRNFSTIDMETGSIRFGPLSIGGDLAPTAVRIREDDDITQSAAWDLPDTPFRLSAENSHSVLLTNGTNRLGELSLVGAIVSVTETDDITQFTGGPGWQTTGVTTLNAQGNAIDLGNPLNQIGPIAITGTATAVGIVEAADITQAAAWNLPSTPITLAATGNDIVLDRAANRLGPLALSAQDVTVVEDHAVTQASAWTVPGLTTVNAGANDIELSQAANNFGTVGVATTGGARVVDVDALAFGATSVGGTLSASAGGAISQTAAATVGTLELDGGGAIRFDHADNEITRLGNIAAPSGIAVNDKTAGLEIAGTLRATAGDVLVHTEGGDLTMNPGSRVEVQGAGNAVLAAGAGFNFINLNTGGIPAVLVDTGRFLVYTTSKTGTVKGNLAGSEAMGINFAANPPVSIAGTDNRFLFADQNMLTITANSLTRLYGDPNPLFTFTVTGFLGGDTLANTLSGAPLTTTVADAASNVGTYAITILPGSLSNAKGYAYTVVDATLSIVPRPVSLSGSRAFDGTRAVGIPTLAIGGTVGGQQLVLSGSAELFDAGVGLNKPLDVRSLSLGDGPGGLASNYTLAGGNHRYNIVSAMTGLPTESPLPRPESAPPREFPITDFRQLPGQESVAVKLLAAVGAFMLPDDLTSRPVEAAAPIQEAAPPAQVSEPAPAPRSTDEIAAVAPQPETRIATLDSPARPIIEQELPPQGITIVFGADEAFAHGKADLTPAGRTLIEREIVKPIRSGYPVASLFITGHTDPTGSEAFNERLAKRRAEAGRNYLLSRGLKPGMVRAEGRGSRQPAPGLTCPISDIACLGPDRRIEIHLSPKPKGPGATGK
jgi:filamentous hemagglutinin family protein